MDMITTFGDYTGIAPLIIMVIGAIVLPGVHLFIKKERITWILALVVSVLSIIINMALLLRGFKGTTLGLVDYNSYSGLMILLFQTVLFLTILVSNASIETTKIHVGAYYSLLMGATLGMMFVAESSDLLTIFVGVELTSISSYAIVSMKNNDVRASEAAIKYVIIGGISTALTIYGISMIYGLFGTTDI